MSSTAAAGTSADAVQVYWNRELPPLEQPSPIYHAYAGRAAKKDEDRWDARGYAENEPFAAFGVFDGHSGKLTAQYCASQILERLVASRTPRDPPTIVDAFWKADEDIGRCLWPQHGPTPDGSTATILVAEKVADAVACVFAWCGDSTAIAVSMSSGTIVASTVDHAAESSDEQGALTRLQAVRRRVEGGSTVRDALEAEAGASFSGVQTLEDEVDMVTRALSRAEAIATVHDIGAASRRNLYVQPRSTAKGRSSHHPLVVATETSHSHPQYYDLQMTRSIGDWKGPDLVLPHPEMRAFEVGAGEHVRAIVASDGLWSVCSHETAAQVARSCPSAQTAANQLLELAEQAYFSRRGKSVMGDDTTVLCVDLNPSQLPFAPPPPAAKRGCTIS